MVDGAEDCDYDVRKEEQAELENLVIFGEGLRPRSARSDETSAEERREPEAADLCHPPPTRNRCDEPDGSRMETFLILRTEGDALGVVRGFGREPGLEQWWRLVALFDPLAAGMSDESRKILLPPKATQVDAHTIQLWKFWNNALVTFLLEDMRLAILPSKCSTDVDNS